MPQTKELLSYIVDKAEKNKNRYEVHSFDSMAVMVDIWVDDKFLVLQIDGDTIGLSICLPDKVVPFTTMPDKVFKDEISFKRAFDDIMNSNEAKNSENDSQ